MAGVTPGSGACSTVWRNRPSSRLRALIFAESSVRICQPTARGSRICQVVISGSRWQSGLASHGANDLALPPVVVRPKLVQLGAEAGEQDGAGIGADEGQALPAHAQTGGERPERCRVPLAAEPLGPDAPGNQASLAQQGAERLRVIETGIDTAGRQWGDAGQGKRVIPHNLS